jgi:hypothetical protein
MIKKYSIVFLILLFTAHCYTKEKNIIKNGSFEIERAGYIAHWATEAFLNIDEAVRFFITDRDAFEGEKSYGIANIQPNDSYITQWVEVEPDSLYRLSGWIKVGRVSGAEIGANISVLGIRGSSKSLLNTNGQWEYVEIYGKTGEDQYELQVAARLGFFGNEVKGIAYFDSIILEKVYSAPTEQVLNFSSSDDKYITLENTFFESPDSENLIIIIFIIVFSIAAIATGIIFMYVYIVRPFWRRFGKFFIIQAPDIIEGANRRRARRKKLKLTIIVRCPTRRGGYREMIFKSLDLSVGGVFIVVDDLSLFRVGDKIEIEIEKKGKRYHMGKARIVRLQMEHNRQGVVINQGIGVQFFTTDESHIKWILSIMGGPGKQEKKSKKKKHSLEKIKELQEQKASLAMTSLSKQEGTKYTSTSPKKTTRAVKKKRSTPTSASKTKNKSSSGSGPNKKSPPEKKTSSTRGRKKRVTSKTGTKKKK